MNNFILRAISAVFIILIGLFASLGHAYIAYGLFLLVALLGVDELNSIFGRKRDWVLIGSCGALVLSSFVYLSVPLIAILGVLYRRHLILFLYSLVIIFGCNFAIGARYMHEMLLLNIFVLSWCHDVGGYFVGKICKGPKIIPSISPGKTWSGFMGGIGFSVLWWFFSDGFVPLWSVVVANFIGFSGDVLESKIKRMHEIKDSGGLIPGHGGILDRFDAFFMIAIFYYILFNFHLVNP